MSEELCTLFGWSLSQWAMAAAERRAEPDITGAQIVARHWGTRHAYAPGKSPIILESEASPDFAWASKMWENVLTTRNGALS